MPAAAALVIFVASWAYLTCFTKVGHEAFKKDKPAIVKEVK